MSKIGSAKDPGMPTAPDTEFEKLPLKLAYPFLNGNGLATHAIEIRKSRDKVGAFTSSLRSAKIIALLRHEGLLDKFTEAHWRFALTPAGKKKLAWYDRLYSRWLDGRQGDFGDEDKNGGDNERQTEFALEEQLRDYLSRNLGILEHGLSLWPVEDGDAVEFQVDEQGRSRRIDILAKDQHGLPVVIEVKVSRGHERTVGQALYYRAKIKERFKSDRVKIFIVAAEISPELRAAASEVSDVVLFEYSLAVKVAKITS